MVVVLSTNACSSSVPSAMAAAPTTFAWPSMMHHRLGTTTTATTIRRRRQLSLNSNSFSSSFSSSTSSLSSQYDCPFSYPSTTTTTTALFVSSQDVSSTDRTASDFFRNDDNGSDDDDDDSKKTETTNNTNSKNPSDFFFDDTMFQRDEEVVLTQPSSSTSSSTPSSKKRRRSSSFSSSSYSAFASSLVDGNSIDIVDDGVVNDDTKDDESSSSSLPVSSSATTTATTATTTTITDNVDDAAPTTSAIVLLNLVAIIWGTQHAIIKTVVADDNGDAAIFTFLRFSLAAICAILPTILSPMSPSSSISSSETTAITTTTSTAVDDDTITSDDNNKEDLQMIVRWGMEMGLWMFAGFSLQAIGLLTTTAQRSGFLLYLNVKLVPLFAKVLYGRTITTSTWISAIAAFTGTALLALDGQSSVGFNVGDVWSVLAAAASAMFILRLETATTQVKDAAELNASSLIVVAILSFGWMLLQLPPSSSSSLSAVGDLSSTLVNHNNQQYLSMIQSMLPTGESIETTFHHAKSIIQHHPFELLYLGGISTALSNFIQTKAQKDISAERASVIYSLDPVYGAFFSWLLLHENLGGTQAFVGATLITVAATTNALLDLSDRSSSSLLSEKEEKIEQ